MISEISSIERHPNVETLSNSELQDALSDNDEQRILDALREKDSRAEARQ